jgi:uncharacterized membrane protein
MSATAHSELTTNSKVGLSGYVLFFVWPLFSVIYAISNWRMPWAKNITWLYCCFFGFTFVISNEAIDANRYSDSLSKLHKSGIGFIEYFDKVKEGLFGRGDYLEPMLRYLVAIFTDDYRVLFAVFGLIMGYFFSRNIWILLDGSGGRVKPHASPLLVMFVFLVPIWLINGFRFWTATHIFVYAAFQMYYYRKYGVALIFLLFSVLTHVAFLLPVTVLILFHLIPKRNWFFICLFFSSLLLVNLDLSFLISIIPDKLGGPAVELIRSYIDEDYVARRLDEANKLNWYVRYRFLPLYIYTIVIAVFLLTIGRNLLRNSNNAKLLYFGILLFSITNIIDIIPSSARFYSLAYLCIFASLFLIAQQTDSSRALKVMGWIAVPFIILPILVEIRMGMEFTGPGTLITNPLLSWYFEYCYAFKSG